MIFRRRALILLLLSVRAFATDGHSDGRLDCSPVMALLGMDGPRLVDRSESGHNRGKFVDATFGMFWVTLPDGGLPEMARKNLDTLAEITRIAQSAKPGDGPLEALARLKAMNGAERDLRIQEAPPLEIDAAELARAIADKKAPAAIFQKVYDAYRFATNYDPVDRTSAVPLAMQVRTRDGNLRALDMNVPEERELGKVLYRLAVEEVLHQVSHQARKFEKLEGAASYQLLTPEARAFAEWVTLRPDQAYLYFPEIEKRYGKAPSFNKIGRTLSEADVTAWLAAHGMPHSPIEIGGKEGEGRPYAVRGLLEIYLRDVYRPGPAGP